MNWDYWKKIAERQQQFKDQQDKRYRQQEKMEQEKEKQIKMTPLERSGLKVITWTKPYGTIGDGWSVFIAGETCNTKMMRFFKKTGLVEDVQFEMVN